MKAAAEITRDDYGIAHIRAGNEHDLFFLQGYVHAEDRLFQMDASRRQAGGTLAELLGPGAIRATSTCARWGSGAPRSARSRCSRRAARPP